MRFTHSAGRMYLAPALGLALVSALGLSACSSSAASSAAATASSLPTSLPSSLPSGLPSSLPSGLPTDVPTSLPTGSSAAGGGSGATGTGAAAQITTNWNKFFNSATPDSERVKLLENGSQFASAISSFSSSPLAAAVSSKVDSVTLTSSTKAKVKYDLTALGQTVAAGSTGSSVLQDGTWKVGDDVFCGLLKEAKSAGMGTTIPAACH